ncbi:MAG: hypothetical protein JSU93_06655 [Methanobacteriota archaeon]|nr:MAG: hypothetical protein JSU93_06655 [Euryarchaeota archaeon]
MDIGCPEAGLPVDRDTVLVVTINQVLVRSHGARFVSAKFLLDSQRVTTVDGHFELEYELKDGALLRIRCKKTDEEITFKVFRNGTQLNYSVPVKQFVSCDLIPGPIEEYEELVTRWLNDLG